MSSYEVTASTRVAAVPERAFTLFTQAVDRWWLPRYRRWPTSSLAFDASWLTERHGDQVHRVARVHTWSPPALLQLELDGDKVQVRFEAEGLSHTRVTITQTRGGTLTPFQDPWSVRWLDQLASFTRAHCTARSHGS